MVKSNNKTKTPSESDRESFARSTPRRTPRLSFSPPPFRYTNSTPRRTSQTRPPSSVDRFIPNRSRLDISQARSQLMPATNDVLEERDETFKGKIQYQRSLHRTLFGNDYSTSILGLSNSCVPSPSNPHPLDQDVLRSFRLMPDSKPVRKQNVPVEVDRNGFFNIPRYFQVDIPAFYRDGNLNLLTTFSGLVAFAVHDKVYFYDEYSNMIDELSGLSDFGSISSLKFCSLEDGFCKSLAIGGNGKVYVFDSSCSDKKAEFTNHEGHVTAFEWTSPNEVAAASQNRIHIHDLRLRATEEGYSLDCSKQNPVTSLKFQDGMVASAGSGFVQLWDIRYARRNEAVHVFKHSKVRGMAFCPHQRHTLATGGSDGAKLWNSATGSQRSTISIPGKTVNCLLWSPYGKELLVSNFYKLSKWSVVPGESYLLEEWGLSKANFNPDPQRIKEYNVVSLDHLCGGRVVSLDARGWLLHTRTFDKPQNLWRQKYSEMDHHEAQFSVIR